MRLAAPPAAASWTHRGAREGFEVAFLTGAGRTSSSGASDDGGGPRLTGHTTASEADVPWSVGYDVTLDRQWRTLTAQVTTLGRAGRREVVLARGHQGRWTVDGVARPDLDGCVDVDLESSAVTNTLPIHRLDLVAGSALEVPAAFVRAEDLRVERLEQRYTLLDVGPERFRVHYESPTFAFACELVYDAAGLILQYPGIAVRTGEVLAAVGNSSCT